MSITDSHLQYLYKGYVKTPLLWKSNPVFGLYQFQIDSETGLKFERTIQKRLRLGQLAEQFVFNQLEHIEKCKILAENVQIQKEKQTLGELDALITFDKKPLHLEIIYKFYLYDDTLGATEIERWIGPNRKDSLIEKINKLKNKQLPLLHTKDCGSTLEQFQLNTEDFEQRVLFKAQLFIPYNSSVVFKDLNQDCIIGYYLDTNQLEEFGDCSFYIPPKLDWLLEVNHSAEWLSFETFKLQVQVFLQQNKSPLVWIKKPNDDLLKCFLVWW